jgi:hypothetical protein
MECMILIRLLMINNSRTCKKWKGTPQTFLKKGKGTAAKKGHLNPQVSSSRVKKKSSSAGLRGLIKMGGGEDSWDLPPSRLSLSLLEMGRQQKNPKKREKWTPSKYGCWLVSRFSAGGSPLDGTDEIENALFFCLQVMRSRAQGRFHRKREGHSS